MERADISALDIAKICPIQIDDGGVIKKVDHLKGVYNVSKGRLSTVVANNYNLIQHGEYFTTFLETLDKLNVKYDAEVIDLGNKAFLDIEFKDKNIKFKKLNEEFTTGIRLSNSYDKSAGLGIIPIYRRLACMNGMTLSRLGTVMVCKHNSLLSKKVDEFIRTRMDAMISQSETLRHYIEESMKDSIEWKLAVKIIQELFKTDEHREEILKRLDISIVEAKNNTGVDYPKGKEAFSFVLDDKKAEKLTRWEIYNAVTNYVSKDVNLSTAVQLSLQRKAEKLFTTRLEMMPLAEIKV